MLSSTCTSHVAVGRAVGRLLEEGRPHSGPEEPKLILYQVGAVFERELGMSTMPSTPTSACSRSIQTTSRRWKARCTLPDRRELAGAAQHSDARVGAHRRRGRSRELPVSDCRALRKSGSMTSTAPSSFTATLNLQHDHSPTSGRTRRHQGGRCGSLAAAAPRSRLYDADHRVRRG